MEEEKNHEETKLRPLTRDEFVEKLSISHEFYDQCAMMCPLYVVDNINYDLSKFDSELDAKEKHIPIFSDSYNDGARNSQKWIDNHTYGCPYSLESGKPVHFLRSMTNKEDGTHYGVFSKEVVLKSAIKDFDEFTRKGVKVYNCSLFRKDNQK